MIAQQLDLFPAEPAPLTKVQQRVLDYLEHKKWGVSFGTMRQTLHIEWLKLGRALDELIARRLVWHNDTGLYGRVAEGGMYPERWFEPLIKEG